MIVPFDRLSPDVLRALIREFVTRDGTDYGEAEVEEAQKIKQVEAMLKRGEVVIVFDEETETCNILTKRDADSAGTHKSAARGSREQS